MKKYCLPLILCGFAFFYGWSIQQAMGMADMETSFVRSADRFDQRCKDNRPYEEDVLRTAKVLDKHRFGESTVTLYDIFYRGESAFYFRATNEKANSVEGLIGKYSDPEDKELFHNYQKMNPQGKRRCIHDLFWQHAKIDIGPLELEASK